MTTVECLAAKHQWLAAFNEASICCRPMSIFDHPLFPGERFTLWEQHLTH